jgi:hypothetical protein
MEAYCVKCRSKKEMKVESVYLQVVVRQMIKCQDNCFVP